MPKTSFGWRQEIMNEGGWRQEVDSVLASHSRIEASAASHMVKGLVWLSGVARKLDTLLDVLQM